MAVLGSLLAVSALAADDRATIHQLVRDSVIREVTATGSMRPAIDETWWVLTQKLPFREVRLDDVILWRRGDTLICHRVIMRHTLSTGEVVLWTKGDANALSDPELIVESMYAGTVVAMIRRLDRTREPAKVGP